MIAEIGELLNRDHSPIEAVIAFCSRNNVDVELAGSVIKQNLQLRAMIEKEGKIKNMFNK